MQAPSAMLNRLLARGKFRHIQGLLYLAELGRAAHRLGVTQTPACLESLLHFRRSTGTLEASVLLPPVAHHLLLGLAGGVAALSARQNQGEGYVRLIAPWTTK